MTFDLDTAGWFVFTLSRSFSKVKVTGQHSRPRDANCSLFSATDARYDVAYFVCQVICAEVVGATSSDDRMHLSASGGSLRYLFYKILSLIALTRLHSVKFLLHIYL